MQVLSRGSRAVPGSCGIILPTRHAPAVSAIRHSHPAPEGTCPSTMELQGQLSLSQDSLQAQEEHAGALKDHHNSPWPSPPPQGFPGSFSTFLPAQLMLRAGTALRQLWGRTQEWPQSWERGHQESSCRDGFGYGSTAPPTAEAALTRRQTTDRDTARAGTRAVVHTGQ